MCKIFFAAPHCVETYDLRFTTCASVMTWNLCLRLVPWTWVLNIMAFCLVTTGRNELPGFAHSLIPKTTTSDAIVYDSVFNEHWVNTPFTQNHHIHIFWWDNTLERPRSLPQSLELRRLERSKWAIWNKKWSIGYQPRGVYLTVIFQI